MSGAEEDPLLDDEEPEIDHEWLKRMVQFALDDPSPDIPAHEVFARLRKRHAERIRSSDGK